MSFSKATADLSTSLRSGRDDTVLGCFPCAPVGMTAYWEEHLHVHSSGLGWGEVTEAFAYKRDCFSFDQICLVVGTADPTQWIEVREDDEGYQEMIQQLPSRIACFPAPDEWLEGVRLPHFAPQWMRIYPRDRRDDRPISG